MRLRTRSSLAKSVEIAQKSSRVILDNFPEVEKVVGKIGTSEIHIDPMPIEAMDLIVVLKDKSEWVSANSQEELSQHTKRNLKTATKLL